ncbi:hypothetical protein F3N42_05220 [Marinihelvus fidelis]|uniref:Uncharacterized protein n=1 Tax=Marinihelvus fidelis TaxID=2613842 RepID=A0A5N0TCZ2_9GAMM|nr:hypothetical protein [Marinihelvus fidelis]KAA9132621.1 hypothetical protein F3N42_05220 [Marinihelvus fidelis]
MSNLVENYLHAVARHLRPEDRDAVLADLRDAIDGELEGLAESSDRSLSRAEVESVLQGFGHPLRVARGYQPQRYLIGPTLYPDWWRTLRFAVVAALAIQVVVMLVIGVTTGWRTGPLGVISQSVSLAFWVAVWVTVAFIALEYSGERLKWYDRWKASSLLDGSVSPVNRGDLLTNLVSEGFFLLWWNGVVRLDSWIPAGTFSFSLADAWAPLYWPLNIVFGLAFLLHLLVLSRGVWQRWTLVIEAGTSLVMLGLVLYLASVPDLLIVSGAPAVLAESWAERTLRIALLVVAGFIAWDAWVAIRAYLRRTDARSSQDAMTVG